jgi:hypothetical protein
MRPFHRIALFNIDPDLVSMPLSRAVLCTNCERVSNSRNFRCDVCGSGAVLALQTILDHEDPTPPEPSSPLAAYAVPLAA